MSKTFTIDSNIHDIGNVDCEHCYDDVLHTCKECNKGLIHSQFIDENYDSIIVSYVCDNCFEVFTDTDF